MTQQIVDIITIVVLSLDALLAVYIVYRLVKRRKAQKVCADEMTSTDVIVENAEENQDSSEMVSEPVAPVLVSTGDAEDEEETKPEEFAIELEREGDQRKVSLVRYRKSFVAKLVLQRHLIDLYLELYNEIMSYEGVKEKTSFKCSRFYKGRKTLMRIFARGKRLYLYLPLNPTMQDSKYFLIDVSDKKIGEDLPSLLKVLSPRSVKYAKELIAQVMENEDLSRNEDYENDNTISDRFYERSFRKLLSQREIIEYRVTRVVDDSFDISTYNPESDEDDEEEENEIGDDAKVSLEEVNLLLPDHLITEYLGKSKNTGKLDIVNLDELEQHFDDNDTITFADLKRLKLISKSAKRVKILARGGLEKTFHVEADDYSKEAIKLIVFNHGTVKYREQESEDKK